MTFTEGDSVKTSKYPGTWAFVSGDEHMSYIKKDGRGTVMVTTSSLTPHTAKERDEVGQEILTAPELLNLATKAVGRLVPFVQPDKAAQMEDLNFTEERLYRDIIAEYILHLHERKINIARVVGQAIMVIGDEVHDDDLVKVGKTVFR